MMNIKVFVVFGMILALAMIPFAHADNTSVNRHHQITSPHDCLAATKSQEQGERPSPRRVEYLPRAYARCLEQARQTHREPSADEKVGIGQDQANAIKNTGSVARVPQNYYRIISKDENEK